MHCNTCSVVKCILIERSGFHVALLNAEDSMHCGAMDPDCMQWGPCSVEVIQLVLSLAVILGSGAQGLLRLFQSVIPLLHGGVVTELLIGAGESHIHESRTV